jgi:hypothetical protein
MTKVRTLMLGQGRTRLGGVTTQTPVGPGQIVFPEYGPAGMSGELGPASDHIPRP